MSINIFEDAINQIEFVRDECIEIFEALKKFCPADANESYPETFRLIATPMFYSVWERCFTTCQAVSLRMIRDRTLRAYDLPPSQMTAWLLRAPFYQSFCAQLKNNNFNLDPLKEAKKGQFAITAEFLSSFEEWASAPLDPACDADDVVMTFSNVNPDVVKVNSQAVGIDSHEDFKRLKFGRLHDLVGLRNSIGHGAIISAPSNDQFRDLWEFTEDLIKDYCATFVAWIRSQQSMVDRG
jgi:hypothetical protein